MSIAIICVRTWVKGLGLPLVSSVSGGIPAEDIHSLIVKFKELIGEELVEKLEKALANALKNEINRALNTDKLEQEIHLLIEKFWARITYPLSEINEKLLTQTQTKENTIIELIDLEERIGIILAKLIRETGYKYAEELVYGLSALIDRDKWIIEKITQLGIEAFIKKLLDRDSKTFIEFANYTMYLTFTWLASTVALLRIIKKYREENLDKLVKMCKEYAEELEDYIDTLDILLKDETYEELVKLGITERKQ